MEILARNLTFSGPEGLHELRRLAVNVEELCYSTATIQADYVRKLSLKLLAMENYSQENVAGLIGNHPAGSNSNFLESAFMYPLSPSGQLDSASWQEEIYQKISSMKDNYLPEICKIYQEATVTLQQLDSLPQQTETDMVTELWMFKITLEGIITFLQVAKNDIIHVHREKLGPYEKQIINFINESRLSNGGPQMPPGFVSPYMQPTVTAVQSQESSMNPPLDFDYDSFFSPSSAEY